MKKLIALTIALSVSGCTMFDKIIGKSAPTIADTITKYCEETDLAARQKLIDAINKELIARGSNAKIDQSVCK